MSSSSSSSSTATTTGNGGTTSTSTSTWKSLHLGEEALGGLSAGIVGTVIGFPLDLVKTRMQTATTTRTSSSSVSSSSVSPTMLRTFTHIIQTEGITALYKGIGPPLISLSILNITTFTQYTYFRNRIYHGTTGFDYRNFLAGVSCSPLSASVSTVENLIKTQMQLDNISKKQYSNSFHCFTTLIRQRNGIRIIYTGHVINTIREATFLGNYFFIYEGMRYYLLSTLNNEQQQSASLSTSTPSTSNFGLKIAVPIAGGLSGALSWFISFPLDCIRASVQGQTTLPSKKGTVQIMNELIRTRGIRGLYAGAGVSILRAFLVSGSRFSAYEGTLYILRGGRDNI